MDMQIDILTLFPESVDAMLNVSILGRCAVCWQRRSSKGGRYGNCTNDKAR